MERALHILHLDGNSRDSDLIELSLRTAGLVFQIQRVSHEEEFRVSLLETNLDLILSDLTPPRFDGMSALALAREHRPEVPFIFLSGKTDRKPSLAALRRGASDYVLKDRIGRLPGAIKRALREARQGARPSQSEDCARSKADDFTRLLAHCPVVLYSMKPQATGAVPEFISENVTRLLGAEVQDCLRPEWWRDHVHPEDRPSASGILARLLAQERVSAEYRLRHKDGRYLWIRDEVRLVRDDQNSEAKAVGSWTDITEQKQTQAELIEASRLAGKAEIATETLHDVRNVLTTVNLSFGLLQSRTKALSLECVRKLSNLLNEQTDLRSFLTEHEQGKKVPEYLKALAERLEQQQEAITGELNGLSRRIDHLRRLVTVQQAYAKVSGHKERIHLHEVLEESLSLNGITASRPGWTIVREFAPIPPIRGERHKLLQILGNLVRNARQACEQGIRSEKIMTLALSQHANWIRVSVSDNGIGIPPENLERVFEHGFTTKKDGHGFGLRSAAIAARELGCALEAQSEGLHRGASFTLKIPCSLMARARP